MKLLDYLGRAFNPSTLKKGNRQTNSAEAVALKEEFASHPSKGITPSTLTRILENAEQGDILEQCELFEDMEERDPHLHAELSKRKRTIVGVPKLILAPHNSDIKQKETAALLTNIILSLPRFDDMLLDLLDAIGHGFSCVEIEWGQVDKYMLPIRFYKRPQRWFQLDKDTRTEIRLRSESDNGEELWPFGWIVHKHAATSSELSRSGLFRVIAWPWLMKQFSLRDFAEYLEIYGLPVKIGKYPRGGPDDDRDNLYRAIQQLGRNVSGVMPDDMKIEFLKESLGSADPFLSMVKYCDDVISQAVLGQTLSASSSSTGLGSGVANLHSEVRQDLLESDVLQLANTLNEQILMPIVALNGFTLPEGQKYKFIFDVSSTEDLTNFSASIKTLAEAGVSMSAEWVRKRAGIPDPIEGTEIIGKNNSLPQGDNNTLITQENAPQDKIASNKEDSQIALKEATTYQVIPPIPETLPKQSSYFKDNAVKLEDAMSPTINAVLKRVKKLLDESSSYEEFNNKLINWFPESEALNQSDILKSAFIAAELMGNYEVKEESNA